MSDATQLSAATFAGEKKLVNIDDLIIVPELQQRDLSDDAAKRAFDVQAKELAEIVGKEDVDPILVIEIGEGEVDHVTGEKVKPGLYPCDGHRRIKGYKLAEKAKIPAIVRKGSWADAVDVSTSANISQVAMPRNPADKRRAVESSLINHWDWSDREHARHCKTGGEIVAKMRPSVEKYLRTFAKESPNGKAMTEMLDSKTRVGKGGKRQAARKKVTKKDRHKIDWSGWEGPFGQLAKFIDHVGELTLTTEQLKDKATGYQKAHLCLKALGSRLKAWSGKRPKAIA